MAFGADVCTSGGMGSFSRSGRYHLPHPFVARDGIPGRASSTSERAHAATHRHPTATRCITQTNTVIPRNRRDPSRDHDRSPTATRRKRVAVGTISANTADGEHDRVEFPAAHVGEGPRVVPETNEVDEDDDEHEAEEGAADGGQVRVARVAPTVLAAPGHEHAEQRDKKPERESERADGHLRAPADMSASFTDSHSSRALRMADFVGQTAVISRASARSAASAPSGGHRRGSRAPPRTSTSPRQKNRSCSPGPPRDT